MMKRLIFVLVLVAVIWLLGQRSLLHAQNANPDLVDVEPDPPRLIKGFKKVVQGIENENMAESIKLFQQTFNLAPG